ncbi:hypothetical protein V2J09_013355 [Rumex salicifolius]
MEIQSTTTAVLLLLLAAATATASDHYLLSCGASSAVANTANTYDGQTWHTDNNSIFSADLSSTISASSPDAAQIPFSTARVFTGNFTYSFPVSPGPKFIRLLFRPSTYSTYSAADSFLTAHSSSGHLLLRNFSAFLYTTTTIIKEFYVHVSTTVLQLSFSPTPPSSHAYINGIEIVSVPETLYVGPTSPSDVANQGVQFQLTNSYAFETAYRLNVGGNEVASNDDAGGMHRRWLSDDQYLTKGFSGSTGFDDYQKSIEYTAATPNYTAPPVVYQTFRWMGKVNNKVKSKVNVTWGFEVDSGFHYLLRLHWCEVTIDINNTNYRVFDVFIDDLTAERGADVFQWAGANTAIYRDYVVYVDGRDGSGSRSVLQLAMHPNTQTQTMYEDILLNGLEVFKLSRSNGSLDAPNPTTTPTPSSNDEKPHSPKSTPSHIIPAVVGALVGAVVLAAIIFLVLVRRRRRREKLSSSEPWSSSTGKSKKVLTSSYKTGSTASNFGGSSTLPSDLCRRFSTTEMKRATSDFSDSLIVGHGGFGNVYRGTVDIAGARGPTPVAIKRLNPLSKQGAREFTTEIEMLSKLRHVNLVSLVGFCDDTGEMILVYEYMPRGTLRDHIFPFGTHPQLPWLRRLEACVGAARGLHYLHSGAGHMIIHRDVKSTNILLDDKWTAKMSDFGLSKLGPTGTDLSHVSTAVKGSFGYVDPEYYRRQQLTEKSDVYSFGVVLFEVVCGRAAVALGLPKDQVNLAVWGRRNHLSGTLRDIVDPSIKGEIAGECLRKFGEVAESCVREDGVERPSMADVVWGLEFALKLQTEAQSPSTVLESSAAPHSLILQDLSATSGTTSSSSEWLFSGSSDQAHSISISGASTTVFSQILKPEGR